MFSTVYALILSMTLATGDFYGAPIIYYPSFTSCMDKAMVITDTYRKSDLKLYSASCVKFNTRVGTSYE